MGLFNFINNKKINGATMEIPENTDTMDNYEIPKEIFIADSDTSASKQEPVRGLADGMEDIYGFLQADYESRGYSDALTNPDASYMADNILLFKLDLNILIQKVTTQHEDQVRNIDFHITTRERAGLMDLVDELQSKRDTIVEHMKKVSEIKEDASRDEGMCQRMILSYKRGFSRGLAAITQSQILNQ